MTRSHGLRVGSERVPPSTPHNVRVRLRLGSKGRDDDSDCIRAGSNPVRSVVAKAEISRRIAERCLRVQALLDRGAIPPGDQAPDDKDDHGADDGADQAGTFTGVVPADRLS